ncbi:MAG: hypothetical protein WCG66_10805 [bacterium]
MKTLSLVTVTTALLFLSLPLRAADSPAKSYPLETCFISGDKLGEMGRPVVFTYEGREIKVCCRDCKKQFEKDPAAGMKKLAEAIAAKPSNSSASSAK